MSTSPVSGRTYTLRAYYGLQRDNAVRFAEAWTRMEARGERCAGWFDVALLALMERDAPLTYQSVRENETWRVYARSG